MFLFFSLIATYYIQWCGPMIMFVFYVPYCAQLYTPFNPH